MIQGGQTVPLSSQRALALPRYPIERGNEQRYRTTWLASTWGADLGAVGGLDNDPLDKGTNADAFKCISNPLRAVLAAMLSFLHAQDWRASLQTRTNQRTSYYHI